MISPRAHCGKLFLASPLEKRAIEVNLYKSINTIDTKFIQLYKNGMKAKTESEPTRERLLRRGLELARRRGLRALTVRELAREAHINLGTFVYHFGTREKFVEQLLERWYAPLFESLQTQTTRGMPALENLRALMEGAAAFVEKNAAMVAQLLSDALAGEKSVGKFLATMYPRHPKLIFEAIRRAQKSGDIRKGDPAQIFIFIVGAVGMPAVAFCILGAQAEKHIPVSPLFIKNTLSQKGFSQRIEWALEGLKTK